MQEQQFETHAARIAASVDVSTLRDSYELVTCDCMGAAAGYVSREYGDYGYRLGIVRAGSAGGIFTVHHSDGSQFYIVSDRYGNVERMPDPS